MAGTKRLWAHSSSGDETTAFSPDDTPGLTASHNHTRPHELPYSRQMARRRSQHHLTFVLTGSLVVLALTFGDGQHGMFCGFSHRASHQMAHRCSQPHTTAPPSSGDLCCWCLPMLDGRESGTLGTDLLRCAHARGSSCSDFSGSASTRRRVRGSGLTVHSAVGPGSDLPGSSSTRRWVRGFWA